MPIKMAVIRTMLIIVAIVLSIQRADAADGCYLPKSVSEPRCYSTVGPPLAVIIDHLGSPIWQGLMPDNPEPRFIFLFENAQCWHIVDWKVGTKEYCITRAGTSLSALKKKALKALEKKKE